MYNISFVPSSRGIVLSASGYGSTLTHPHLLPVANTQVYYYYWFYYYYLLLLELFNITETIKTYQKTIPREKITGLSLIF